MSERKPYISRLVLHETFPKPYRITTSSRGRATKHLRTQKLCLLGEGVMRPGRVLELQTKPLFMIRARRTRRMSFPGKSLCEVSVCGLMSPKLICADRMLVRIGHHQEENIPVFDEASQVRP